MAKRGCGCGCWVPALLLTLAVLGFYALIRINVTAGVPTGTPSGLLLDPPPPLQTPLELRVATFNIHNPPLDGEHSHARMRSIGAKLMVLDPDVVGFQASMAQEGRAALIEELSHSRLQHFQYYPSGLRGSGLLIASAFPIEEIHFHRYASGGAWYMFWEGGFWMGTGAALARLELPGGGYLDFFNAHAQDARDSPRYEAIRETQLREFADFVTRMQGPTLPSIAVGDLHESPGDRGYDLLLRGARLERMMTLPSRHGHIFAVESEHYDFEVLDTEVIEEQVRVGDMEFDLSPYSGYISSIRITPRAATPPGTAP